MIQKIGVIYQDVISLGFLRGLKERLGCAGEEVAPPASVGATRLMTSKQRRIACEYFRKQGVDVVVRFTDADRNQWQDIRREELRDFPTGFQDRVICGVANKNPEDWLAAVPGYLISTLRVDRHVLGDADRTGAIKRAIAHARGPDERTEDVVCRLVATAPAYVFKQWLQDAAFRQFYQDCRSIAVRLGCTPEPTNEL